VEEQVRECCDMLNHIVMQVGMDTTWRGYLEPVKGYVISRVYHLLALVEQPDHSNITNIIWNKAVMVKVSLFV
jgi:hypothetical protein